MKSNIIAASHALDQGIKTLQSESRQKTEKTHKTLHKNKKLRSQRPFTHAISTAWVHK